MDGIYDLRDEKVVINLVGLDFYDLTLGQPLVEDCVADEVRYSGIVIFFHPLAYDFFFLGREADIVKVFANIGFEYQPFHFETEGEQLKEDNWIGRSWRCPNFIIRLEKLKGYANLCLIISPLAEQSAQTA